MPKSLRPNAIARHVALAVAIAAGVLSSRQPCRSRRRWVPRKLRSDRTSTRAAPVLPASSICWRSRWTGGVVALSGFASSPTTKSEAARAVKQVAGVDEVANQIELLPASQMDEAVRWATFYSIYTDDFLSRCAPGGAMRARYEAANFARFPGMQPVRRLPDSYHRQESTDDARGCRGQRIRQDPCECQGARSGNRRRCRKRVDGE